MRGAADRCQRIGACRKTGIGVMCPSYMATREEEHATRGRANALVKALSQPDPKAALGDERLHEILDLCLECKACKSECPLSVDMASLKSEFLSHYQDVHGVPLRSRLFGSIRRLNRLGAATAPLSNLGAARCAARARGRDRPPAPAAALRARDADPLAPPAARRRPRAARSCSSPTRFTTFTEPAVGRAAIELLEAAGYARAAGERRLLRPREHLQGPARPGARHGRRHGRAAGAVRRARRADRRLRAVVPADAARGAPRAAARATRARGRWPTRRGSSRSCWSRRSTTASLRLTGPARRRRIVFHGHCHQKALAGTTATVELLRRIPGAEVVELDAGCCGMAGSFGFEAEHYELSMQIGEIRLFPALRGEDAGTLVAATGVSCRQQIAHGVGREARHPVQIVREAL